MNSKTNRVSYFKKIERLQAILLTAKTLEKADIHAQISRLYVQLAHYEEQQENAIKSVSITPNLPEILSPDIQQLNIIEMCTKKDIQHILNTFKQHQSERFPIYVRNHINDEDRQHSPCFLFNPFNEYSDPGLFFSFSLRSVVKLPITNEGYRSLCCKIEGLDNYFKHSDSVSNQITFLSKINGYLPSISSVQTRVIEWKKQQLLGLLDLRRCKNNDHEAVSGNSALSIFKPLAKNNSAKSVAEIDSNRNSPLHFMDLATDEKENSSDDDDYYGFTAIEL